MKIFILLCVAVLLLLGGTFAQVAINTDGSQPDASAMMDVQSTEQGFLPPRMTSSERNAIVSPAEGLIVYNTDENSLNVYQGTAWFDLRSRAISPGGPTNCPAPDLASDQTQVVAVLNSTTGETWMDRNLGAYTAARQSDDCWSYGNLYQWGRASDGHELRTSATTTTLSGTDVPGHDDFILAPSNLFDWRNPQNDNLWQGLNGTNNPCPSGYRLPTGAELEAERVSWAPNNNSTGAFASPLKCSVAGFRSYSDGWLTSVGTNGYYWSSTVNSIKSSYLYFTSGNAELYSDHRAYGLSVRCIKD